MNKRNDNNSVLSTMDYRDLIEQIRNSILCLKSNQYKFCCGNSRGSRVAISRLVTTINVVSVLGLKSCVTVNVTQ